uniref:Ring finger protein 128 n=1 Tax=Latimeria chalumnae TaxID=7897 RepID=M3XL43_LATCH|nr:PREDICTED: E3 ubiquitin-protein ligase RNF128 isoform X2 [Latimeria chalumnae]|eukprot:XP_014341515.1 PREDICTED: E3 ubiquitin-protein ligase RNF128 isoform X2 [Latimeria chalumnae]
MVWKVKYSFLWLLVTTITFQGTAKATTVWTAFVNISYNSTSSKKVITERCDCGLYGLNSPLADAKGVVGIPRSRNLQACDTNTEFTASGPSWIALIERGNCTFSDKINLATKRGASAAVIFNLPHTGNEIKPMVHYDATNTVAIMIGNGKGNEIVNLLEKNIEVMMTIEVGKRHGPWISHYSIFFVSVSFFIVTAATVGYFIFYSARRFRTARAQNKRQKRLKADAKKAIGQLQLRTIKPGDKETGPDADSCAVCIEVYKPNDVVRILTCNHLFHKSCIDPWLLEHRTCPMCKCDILKALGVEADVEEGRDPLSASTDGNHPNGHETSTPVEEDSHSETASSGYASVQGVDEPIYEEPIPSNSGHLYQANDNPSHMTVDVVPHYDNPVFEGEENRAQEVRS